MANLKIPDLTDGTAAQAGDLVEISRAGASKRVPIGAAAGKEIGSGADQVPAGNHTHAVAWADISGKPDFPETLEADRIYYVDEINGDDSNDGLSAGNAFETGQKAADVIAGLNFSTYEVTLEFLGAAVTGDILFEGIGARGHGNNAFFNVGGSAKIDGVLYAMAFENCTVECFVDELTIGTGGILASKGSLVNIAYATPVIFDDAGLNAHITVLLGGDLALRGDYSITGDATAHLAVQDGGRAYSLAFPAPAITLIGTPAFSDAFAYAHHGGQIRLELTAPTFTGGATGVRYLAELNGIIDTGGGGASYLPGNSSGSTATGGQYV